MLQGFKFIQRISLFVFAVVLLGTYSYAQRVVHIAPGFGNINSTIWGDTTSTGARDTTTIYELQRGGYYILNGDLEFTFPVTIVADSSSGPMPMLVEGVPSGGTAADQDIRIRANMNLRSLHITALDELGGIHLRVLRLSSNGIRVRVDSCILDLSSQSGLRFDGSNMKVYVTNTLVSNIGQTASPDNGRVFDGRGSDLDTLVSVNNTFYNITERVLRWSGGVVLYAKFDHNTMDNIGSGAIDFGECYTSILTNNIFMNCGFYGSRVSSTPQDYNVTLDSVLVDSAQMNTDYSNNNFFIASSDTSILPDTVKRVINFSPTAQIFLTAQGTANTNISESLSFTKGPALPIDVVNAYWNDPSGTQPSLDTTDHANFNFAYSTTAQSYTAGTNGQPLGDLSWFSMTTGIKAPASASIPSSFALSQNYPNPFNPTTIIQYKISKASNVVLSIYNTLGQLIKTLVNKNQSPGLYSVNWDGTNASGMEVVSGVYLYHISAGGFTSTKKMILLK
jgi:FlgD Ig-like domain